MLFVEMVELFVEMVVLNNSSERLVRHSLTHPRDCAACLTSALEIVMSISHLAWK